MKLIKTMASIATIVALSILFLYIILMLYAVPLESSVKARCKIEYTISTMNYENDSMEKINTCSREVKQ